MNYHTFDKPEKARRALAAIRKSFSLEAKDEKDPIFMRSAAEMKDLTLQDEVWHTSVLMFWTLLFSGVLIVLLKGGYLETTTIDRKTGKVEIKSVSIVGTTAGTLLSLDINQVDRFEERKKDHVLNKNRFDKIKQKEERYAIALVYRKRSDQQEPKAKKEEEMMDMKDKDKTMKGEEKKESKPDFLLKSRVLRGGDYVRGKKENRETQMRLQTYLEATQKKNL